MTQPIGEEFIRIRPDASTFRAELQAQIAGALPAVQAQVAAAQRAVSSNVARSGAVVLPTGQIKGGVQALEQAAVATNKLGTATRKASADNERFRESTREIQQTTAGISRGVQTVERDLGRYTRGMVAATAASTGFFRAVSFASGAFLLGAAAGAAVGSAINEFNQMTIVAARTNALITATGGAANVTGAQVDALAKRILSLTGVDDELVKQGADVLLTFRKIRNEVGEGNDVFNRATKAVVDISNVFGTDLRGSAVQLGKALQDPIRGVTALRRSGITLSQSQRDLIKAMVGSGRILSAQKLILGEVERQVGGTSEAIGKTLPGRLRILREESVNSLGEYVKRINESEVATELFEQASQGISETFAAIRNTLKTVGPPLTNVALGIGRVVQSVGGLGAVIAGVVAFKGLTLAAGAATTASRLFAAASLSGAQAAIAQAAAAGTEAAALDAVAVSQLAAARAAQKTFTVLTGVAALFAAGAFASGQYEIAVLALGAALAGLVIKAIAARNALIAATGAARAGAIASAALGGPLGIAALGVGVLAVGLFELGRIGDRLPGSLGATKRALDSLNTSLAANNRLRAQRGAAQEDVSIGRQEQLAAQRAANAAQRAVANTGAAPGSAAQIVADFKLQEAQKGLADAIKKRIQAEKDLDAVNERLRISQQNLTASLPNQTAEIEKQISAFQRSIQVKKVFGVPLGFETVTHSVDETIQHFEELGQQGDKTAAAIAAVGTVTQAMFGRLPDKRELAIIISLRAKNASTNQILQRLGFATTGGGRGAEQVRLAGLAQVDITATAQQEAIAQLHVLTVLKQKAKTAREAAAAQRQAADSARSEVDTAREGLRSANNALAAARQNLRDSIGALADAVVAANKAIADAIRSAKQATDDAVQSAKQNLESLAQSLADLLGTARKELGSTTNSLSAAARQRLREQIVAGQGGPQTQRIQQQIAFELQSTKATVDTDKTEKALALLAQDVDTSAISMKQFNRRLGTILTGVDLNKLKQIDPVLARRLNDEITAIRQQARVNISAGVGVLRPGRGDQPEVVNIAKTVREGAQSIVDAQVQAAKDIKAANRTISDATGRVSEAEHDVARAQRRLAEATEKLNKEQTRETKLNTKAMKANTLAINQLRRVQGDDTLNPSKKKPKPNANAGKTAGNQTKAGIGTQ